MREAVPFDVWRDLPVSAQCLRCRASARWRQVAATQEQISMVEIGLFRVAAYLTS
jgi:hypothetical protein